MFYMRAPRARVRALYGASLTPPFLPLAEDRAVSRPSAALLLGLKCTIAFCCDIPDNAHLNNARADDVYSANQI